MPRTARVEKPQRVPPVMKTKEIDSRKFEAPPRIAEEVVAPEGAVGFEVEPIQVVDGPKAMSMAEALAFAEDKITIIIHPSGEKNPEDPVYVGVNGRGCYIWRNQKTIVPRKYVERLLRAQADNYSQDTTATTERDFNRLKITATQRYPLSVLHDPHRDGAAWLQQISHGG